MPSPIAHSVTGYFINEVFPVNKTKQFPSSNHFFIVFAAIIIANAPDLDFIPQIITGNRYHHGFSHSLVMVLIVSSISMVIGYILNKKFLLSLFVWVLLLYSSHLLLDFFTAGGRGIQLFWPFSDSFFISDISLFPSTHHSKGIFAMSHLVFISFELIYSGLLLIFLQVLKRKNWLNGVIVGIKTRL